MGDVLSTRVRPGRLFSSLEGSIRSLCPGQDGALPNGCSQSVQQPGAVPHGVVGGPLGISQHSHARLALTCFGLTPYGWLQGCHPCLHCSQCTTPRAPSPQAPGRVLGSLTAQLAPCSPSSWYIMELGLLEMLKDPQAGPMGLAAGQLCMAWGVRSSLIPGSALLAAPRMHYLADSGECEPAALHCWSPGAVGS